MLRSSKLVLALCVAFGVAAPLGALTGCSSDSTTGTTVDSGTTEDASHDGATSDGAAVDSGAETSTADAASDAPAVD